MVCLFYLVKRFRTKKAPIRRQDGEYIYLPRSTRLHHAPVEKASIPPQSF